MWDLSISPLLTRRVNDGWVPADEAVRKPSPPPEIKRRYDDEIHGIGQARRELGPSAQGTHGRYSDNRRRGGPERHDARERRPRANRTKHSRPGFQGAANRDRWAFH